MRVIQRRRGWISVLAVSLLFLLAGLFAGLHDSNGTPRWPRRRPAAATEHPISALMRDARNTFIQRLARQSKTLPEAVVEYKRRYGRAPPRGFDDWWAFAQEHAFVLVDEFDAIAEDLAPFWELSGEEFRRRAFQAGHLQSVDLMHIEDGEAFEVLIEKNYEDKERGQRFFGFLALIEKFQHKLPDMDIAINTKADGRVLVPWEHLNYPNKTQQDSFGGMTNKFTAADWRGGGNVWEEFRRTCPPHTPARQLYTSYRNPNVRKKSTVKGESDGFAFATTVDDNFDFCQHPWARYMQGHFFSDWRTTPNLYPVFSPSKAQGFADIRIPSHYYHRGDQMYTYAWDPSTTEAKTIDDMEVPWDKKSDRIFWRGATTGGGNNPPGFSPTYQRHRFLRMADERTPHNVTIAHALPSHPDTFISTTLPAKDVNNDIMDVAFVTVVGAYPGGDSELRKYHRFADRVPLGKHWSYKYLIDLDGMSYSGRFMALLASDSAVLKSTVYKEYFSDWIQPWLHYIPISASYSEIYNVHAYFSGPSASVLNAANQTAQQPAEWEAVKRERDHQLRQIARAGKQWRHTIGRTVDMEVYVYRLCLEYARLSADDRDAMNFVL